MHLREGDYEKAHTDFFEVKLILLQLILYITL